MRPWLFAAALLWLPASTARGQGVEITPLVGYRFGGSLDSSAAIGSGSGSGRVELADSASFGIHLGYAVGEGEIELLYARQNTRLQTADLFVGAPLFDLALETWQLGGNYCFGESDARARPFVGIGLGLSRLLPEPAALSDETRFSASLGAGVKLWAGSHVGLRLEGRWFVTVVGADSRSFCSSGSCQIFVENSQVISQADLRAGLILRF